MPENAETPACAGCSYPYPEFHDRARQPDYGSQRDHILGATLPSEMCHLVSVRMDVVPVSQRAWLQRMFA